MKRILTIACFISLLQFGCKKDNSSSSDIMLGAWIIKGSDGSGPGGTLLFSRQNGQNILHFNSSGSPGPNWPVVAQTEYKISFGKLQYNNYYDSSQGFYTINSFNWIAEGQEFEIELRELLLYMSSNNKVRYIKVP
jgi:hypothetical protein